MYIQKAAWKLSVVSTSAGRPSSRCSARAILARGAWRASPSASRRRPRSRHHPARDRHDGDAPGPPRGARTV